MCGIFGLLSALPRPVGELKQYAERQFAALAHRGPNDRGWAAFAPEGKFLASERSGDEQSTAKAGLLLGQTRLSIIDLSPAGHQPMHSGDGRYTLVCNGEIYNYIELRRELAALGHSFSGHSDTEVLLAALIEWGEACLPRLTGMFAFAFYDAHARSLLCGRDFFGIKPFYYHQGGAGLAFASEIPALLESPHLSRELAAQQVYTYLRHGRYDIGGSTFFRDIQQLPPAHTLSVRPGASGAHGASGAPEITLRRWWKPDLALRSSLSFQEAAGHLQELFLDSVRLHLRSDLPLGVALSGGIDSSAVACAVRKLEPEAELHAFSFIAANSPVSEEYWANIAASHIRATRHSVTVKPQELAQDLDAMIRRLGEPFGSTSIYAQYRVFKLAQESGITVTLDGQGADELLAGYDGYPGQRASSLLLRGDIAGAVRFLRAWRRWPGRTLKPVLTRTLRELLPERLIPLGLRLAGRQPFPSWLDSERFRQLGVATGLPEDRRALFPHRDKVRQTLASQLVWDSLPSLLRHGDRNAMAFSVESRVPFLTKDIAEFCLSLPEEYLIDMQGRTKSVFRQAMRGIVPDEILDRRDKIGFATPERDWLRELSPWIAQTLHSAKDIPYLNMEEVRKDIPAALREKGAFDWSVWRRLNYIRWIQVFSIR
ncbi:asparagine synthase (glutamine-hydrolyzing) [Desulfovibrio sp. OttesenSCG-928-G11]|nr:asparagine synthase (glutamine-hydrolyzing) [Desulfovibrio sp. OttesenSCG-928-G11]